MNHQSTITILVLLIVIGAGICAATGVFSGGGPGPYTHESIRGHTVDIHGRGIYRHMSADVAVQGIGQDWITLVLGLPLLLAGLVWARRGSPRARFFLAGVLAYFLVTYLFYLLMGTYNPLFLLYAFLLGAAFFAFSLTLGGLIRTDLQALFAPRAPVRLCGGFLMVNTFSIALLWLGVIIPPLLDGSVYPPDLQHYTTLVVQGLDLGLLLPISFVSGWLLWRKRSWGYLLGPIYLVFLSLLMIALTAKIIAMGMIGAEIFPAVIIIPATAAMTIVCALLMLRRISAHEKRIR